MKATVMAVMLALAGGTAAAADDIEFYTTKYVGDEIAYENVGCGKPAIPPLSQTKNEIKKVSDEMEAWRTCYNAYTERLASLQPVGKALPPGLAERMTPAQLEQAKNRMAQVYNAVIDEAEAVAKVVMAEHSAWMVKTDEWVKQEDARQKDKRTQLDRMAREMSLDRGNTRGSPLSAGGSGK